MDALYFGMVAAGMMEHGVVFAESSNLNDLAPGHSNLFGGSPHFLDTARAHVLELLGEMVGATPVATSLLGNPTATGSGAYPALRVLAARGPEGAVRILVVNRDRSLDIPTRIHVDGASGTVKARVLTVDGATYTSLNTFADQTQVITVETSQTVATPDFGHVFPAHSATLLEVG
jgi:alpha-L-arabinofuranosidase